MSLAFDRNGHFGRKCHMLLCVNGHGGKKHHLLFLLELVIGNGRQKMSPVLFVGMNLVTEKVT